MGVKGLSKLLTGVGRDLDLAQCKGERWAIDASIFIYRAVLTGTRQCPHVHGIYELLKSLMTAGIKPILVLDGEVPPIKQSEVETRKGRTRQLRERIATTTDPEEQARLEKSLPKFHPDTEEHIIRLADHLGIPIYRAPYESDPFCARLVLDGHADRVLSEDMDILMYGVNLVNKWTWRHPPQSLTFTEVLEHLGLTTVEQFRMLCLVCGTDYNPQPSLGGPKRALELLRSGSTPPGIDHQVLQWIEESCQMEIDPPAWLEVDVSTLAPFLHQMSNYRLTTIQRHWE